MALPPDRAGDPRGFTAWMATPGVGGNLGLRRRGCRGSVHGCFWHRHEGCPRNTTPKTRMAYWLDKLDGNAQRDRENNAALREMGWRVFVIWECETKDLASVTEAVRRFLGPVPRGHSRM